MFGQEEMSINHSKFHYIIFDKKRATLHNSTLKSNGAIMVEVQ